MSALRYVALDSIRLVVIFSGLFHVVRGERQWSGHMW